MKCKNCENEVALSWNKRMYKCKECEDMWIDIETDEEADYLSCDHCIDCGWDYLEEVWRSYETTEDLEVGDWADTIYQCPECGKFYSEEMRYIGMGSFRDGYWGPKSASYVNELMKRGVEL